MPIPLEELELSPRLRITQLLQKKPKDSWTIAEVAEELNISYELARYHLNQLHQNGKLIKQPGKHQRLFFHWNSDRNALPDGTLE